MERPIALKLLAPATTAQTRIVALDPALAAQLSVDRNMSDPGIIVVQSATVLEDMSVGMVDAADIVGMVTGDWNNAVLVVLPQAEDKNVGPTAVAASGDELFIADAKRRSKDKSLAGLAASTLAAVRAVGVEGELVEQGQGRWVNRPVNSFTLKVQPRAGDIAFTLYGNPRTYGAGDFLRQDQNSYSRGWVKSPDDVTQFALLVKEAHGRRNR